MLFLVPLFMVPGCGFGVIWELKIEQNSTKTHFFHKSADTRSERAGCIGLLVRALPAAPRCHQNAHQNPL